MFALNRRRAWATGIVAPSSWGFGVGDIRFVQAHRIKLGSGSGNWPRFLQFVGNGQSLIYATGYSFYRVALETPYSLVRTDGKSFDEVTEVSGNIFAGSLTSGQFTPDGRRFIAYKNANDVDNFRLLSLDVAFDPFGKSSADLVREASSSRIYGANNMQFSADGLSLFTFSDGLLKQYYLSEPFRTSTVSLSSRSLDLKAIDTGDSNSDGFTCFAMSPDGLRVVTAGAGVWNGSGYRIRLWALQDPWDLRRVTHVGTTTLDPLYSGIRMVSVDPTVSFLYAWSGSDASGSLVQYAIQQS